jgi:hypothetical protein
MFYISGCTKFSLAAIAEFPARLWPVMLAAGQKSLFPGGDS